MKRSLAPPIRPLAEERAFRSFVRAWGLFRNVMEPFFAGFGISGAQWGVLRTLHRAELEGIPSLRLTELSARLVVRPPSVTGVVDRLERMKLMTRRPSTADRRAKEASLTPAGRRLVNRVLRSHRHQVRRVMSAFSTREARQLLTLMNRFVAHLERLEQ
jgi:DNA-binding MarR family transcriptional regulator